MNEKISAQAKAVLAVLSEQSCHLTAEEILSRLGGIGMATVYRALDHLVELGLVRRLSLGKRSAVYEYVRQHHAHLVCQECGGVYDIPADLSGVMREAARCCGHEAQICEVTARGICKECIARKQQNEQPNQHLA